jgi:hypothetical protein
MTTIAEIYCEDLHDNFQELYATWPIGNPLQLGDYGVLKKNSVFVRLGNVSQHGIQFTTRSDPTKDDYEYKSANEVEVKSYGKLDGQAGGATINAHLEIEFASRRAVFFFAADCTYDSIDDQVALGNEIMARYDQKKWKGEWVVVSSLLSAAATTAIVSGAKSGSISLEATANVDRVDLADANVGVAVKAEKNLDLKTITAQGMQPLMGLSQVQPKWRRGPFHGRGNKWGPRSILLADVDLIRESVETEGIKTQDAFFFGELR